MKQTSELAIDGTTRASDYLREQVRSAYVRGVLGAEELHNGSAEKSLFRQAESSIDIHHEAIGIVRVTRGLLRGVLSGDYKSTNTVHEITPEEYSGDRSTLYSFGRIVYEAIKDNPDIVRLALATHAEYYLRAQEDKISATH